MLNNLNDSKIFLDFTSEIFTWPEMRISESRTAADGPGRGRRRESAVVGKDGALPDEKINKVL
jgi:hypothetical protein